MSPQGERPGKEAHKYGSLKKGDGEYTGRERKGGQEPQKGKTLTGSCGGPPTKGHRDPTIDIKWLTPEAYESIPRGHPGGEEGKERSCGKNERPREEECYSEHLAHDYREDAPEVGWQTTPDHLGQEAGWIQANAEPEAICTPPYSQDSRSPREAQQPGERKQLQGPEQLGARYARRKSVQGREQSDKSRQNAPSHPKEVQEEIQGPVRGSNPTETGGTIGSARREPLGKDPGAIQSEEDLPHFVDGSHTEFNSRAHSLQSGRSLTQKQSNSPCPFTRSRPSYNVSPFSTTTGKREPRVCKADGNPRAKNQRHKWK